MTVNNELDNIGEWFKANKLSLNNNKKQMYRVRTKKCGDIAN